MAINFPDTPIDGSTYDYDGIRYTFIKNGTDQGYWSVTTPGTVGIATSVDINNGVDDVKYITPLGLDGSTYRTQLDTNTNDIANISVIIGAMFPVGHVLITTNENNPTSYGYPGTWAKINSGYSLQAVDSGAGGYSGSNSQAVPLLAHTHTGASHSHTVDSHSHTGPSHTHTANHNHTASSNSTGAHTHTFGMGGSDFSTGTYADRSNQNQVSKTTSSAGSHSHTITVNTKNFSTGASGTGSTGTSSPGTNTATGTTGSAGDNSASMDVSGANFEVYMWERTA